MTASDAPQTSTHHCCGGCAPRVEDAPAGAPRRSVLRGGALAAAAGAGAIALSGCTQEIKDKESAQSHYAGSEPTAVLAADELPVGSSKEVKTDGRTLLLHRAAEDEVTAYSNVCTHQGCLVTPVDTERGPAYACPCHGSNFDAVTGKPFGGPARQPLMDYEASVQDGQILVKL